MLELGGDHKYVGDHLVKDFGDHISKFPQVSEVLGDLCPGGVQETQR